MSLRSWDQTKRKTNGNSSGDCNCLIVIKNGGGSSREAGAQEEKGV